MRAGPLVILSLVLFACCVSAARPTLASAQLTPADSASVLLDAARSFDAAGSWEVADAVYRFIVERYGLTAAAAEAGARLAASPREVVYGSGQVELQVWMTLYGSWLGIAFPGALGTESSGPYGIGLLLGGPTGFVAGRSLARSLSLTEGQARAITLGGTWGTWQGFGQRRGFQPRR